MENMENGKPMTSVRRQYIEAFAKLSPEEQEKAASFVAGLLAAAKNGEKRPA